VPHHVHGLIAARRFGRDSEEHGFDLARAVPAMDVHLVDTEGQTVQLVERQLREGVHSKRLLGSACDQD